MDPRSTLLLQDIDATDGALAIQPLHLIDPLGYMHQMRRVA